MGGVKGMHWISLSPISLALTMTYFLHMASASYYSVESVATSHRCSHDSECVGSQGETCVRLYEGCTIGRCMCDPRLENPDASGICQPIARYKDYCTSHEACPLGMECFERECVCEVGSRLTPDSHRCLRRWQKLLGDLCEPEFDTCYHRSDHSMDYVSSSDVHCSPSSMVCECAEGFKERGVTCQRRSLGERGCLYPHHCRGGALCLGGQCQCPDGYEATADPNAKCVKVGAVTDLQLGDACDETGESRYCGSGLVCYYCNASHAYQCVRFTMMNTAFPMSRAAAIHAHAHTSQRLAFQTIFTILLFLAQR